MRQVRSLDLWDLVCWTYRDQKAHLYLKTPGDFYEWVISEHDVCNELDTNVPVHFDAAMVHGTVVEMWERNFMSAMLIVQHAISCDRPEVSSTISRPFPMHPDEGRLLLRDRPSWHQIDGRRVRSVIRSDEKIEIAEHVIKKAKRGRLGAVEKRIRLEPIEYCPVEWFPSAEFVEMQNAIYREWTEAMVKLRLMLEDEKLKNHRISGFDFDPPPLFQEPDLAAGKREPDIAARIEPLTGFAQGVSWIKSADGKTVEPKTWKYRRVLRCALIRPELPDIVPMTACCA